MICELTILVWKSRCQSPICRHEGVSGNFWFGAESNRDWQLEFPMTKNMLARHKNLSVK